MTTHLKMELGFSRQVVILNGEPMPTASLQVVEDRERKLTMFYITVPHLDAYMSFIETLDSAPSLDAVMRTWNKEAVA